MKKTILVLLLILLASVPLSAVKGQGTYILITEKGVEGSDSITMDGNIFTINEPIRKPIKIEVDNIVLDGNNNKMEVVTSYDAVTLTGRNNVVLKNIRINIAGNGIVLESSNMCTIQNCTIKTSNDGIRLTDASTQNTIQGNTINANKRVGILLKEQSNENTVSGNIINDNIVGIAFEDSHRLEVFDNQINGNELDGIHSDASNENLFHHNVANENDQGLALKAGSTNNQVYENVFNYNLDNGIDVDDSDDNRVFDNEMGYNVDYGIDVDVCTLNHFYQNNIHDNRGGIDFDNAEGNYIYSNNFVENRNQVTYDSEKNIWNSTSSVGGNYWSDYEGEDLNGDGYGDAPRYFRSIIIGGVETIDTDNLDYYPLMELYKRPSEITCTVDKNSITEDESLLISGQITPAPPADTNVLVKLDKPTGDSTEDVYTDVQGNYELPYSPDEVGDWSISASWGGNTKYLGDTSDPEEFNVEAAEIIIPTEPDKPTPVPTELNTRWPYLEGTIYYYGESYVLEVTLRNQHNEAIKDEQLEMVYQWENLGGHGPVSSVIETTDEMGIVEFEFVLYKDGAPDGVFGDGLTWEFTVSWVGNEDYEGTSTSTSISVYEYTPEDNEDEIPGYSLISIIIGILGFGYLSRARSPETLF